MFGGHVVSNSNMPASNLFVSETMGREAQARARRKRGGGKDKEAEEALVLRMGEKGKELEGRKVLYSATFVKKLGFDPSSAGVKGSGDGMNKDVQEKVCCFFFCVSFTGWLII